MTTAKSITSSLPLNLLLAHSDGQLPWIVSYCTLAWSQHNRTLDFFRKPYAWLKRRIVIAVPCFQVVVQALPTNPVRKWKASFQLLMGLQNSVVLPKTSLPAYYNKITLPLITATPSLQLPLHKTDSWVLTVGGLFSHQIKARQNQLKQKGWGLLRWQKAFGAKSHSWMQERCHCPDFLVPPWKLGPNISPEDSRLPVLIFFFFTAAAHGAEQQGRLKSETDRRGYEHR